MGATVPGAAFSVVRAFWADAPSVVESAAESVGVAVESATVLLLEAELAALVAAAEL